MQTQRHHGRQFGTDARSPSLWIDFNAAALLPPGKSPADWMRSGRRSPHQHPVRGRKGCHTHLNRSGFSSRDQPIAGHHPAEFLIGQSEYLRDSLGRKSARAARKIRPGSGRVAGGARSGRNKRLNARHID